MSARYYVAPDGDGDPTIWRDFGEDDRRPRALLTYTIANAELFDLVADLLIKTRLREGLARWGEES